MKKVYCKPFCEEQILSGQTFILAEFSTGGGNKPGPWTAPKRPSTTEIYS